MGSDKKTTTSIAVGCDDDRPPEFHSMLVALTGAHVGKAFALASRSMRIGRGSNCEILLDDPGISRVHATITTSDFRHFLLNDQDSTNGIFLAGERVDEHELNDGDQFQLGNEVVLRFVGRRELSAVTGEFDAVDEIYTEDYLKRALNAQVQRGWEGGDVGLLTVHVDHLAMINDIHGPEVGDQVLDTVRRHLTSLARSRLGRVARLAGSYFMVLLPNHTVDEATSFAHEVVGNVHADAAHRDLEGSVAISAGVASLQLLRNTLRSPSILDDADVERHSSSLAKWTRSLCSSAQQRGGNEVVSAGATGGTPENTMTFRMPLELPALIERASNPRYSSRYAGLIAFELADETALIGHAGAGNFDRYFGHLLDGIAHSITRGSDSFVGRWKNRYAFAVVGHSTDPQQLRRDVADRWQARWPEGYDGLGNHAQIRQTFVTMEELSQAGERLPHLLRERFDDVVATARSVKRDLPFPLEAPKIGIRSRSSSFSQVSHTLDALEVGYQFLAALAFGVAASRHEYQALGTLLRDKSGTGPLSMGAWEDLAWALARHHAASAVASELTPIFRGLVSNSRGRSAIAQTLHGAVALRNRSVVHTVTRDEAGYGQEARQAGLALDAMLELFEPLREFEMVTVVSTVFEDDGVSQTYTLRRHQGPVEQFPLIEKTMEERMLQRWCYLLPPDGSALGPICLAPFFFTDTCALCGRIEVYAADRPVLTPEARVSAKAVTTGHDSQFATPKSRVFVALSSVG